MAVAQLLLSMEPKYICHNQCTMDTSSPIVPKLSTEILLIPAILELYHKPPLKRLHFLCTIALRNEKGPKEMGKRKHIKRVKHDPK